MGGAQIVTVVITLLVPVVAAVAGIVGVMFQDWRVQRSQAGRRRLALEDAQRQVTFVTAWWNASKLLAGSPEAMRESTALATAWLERTSAGIPALEMPAVAEKRRITFRRLLLFYPLPGTLANIIRAGFYLLLAALTLGVGTTISDVLEFPRSAGYDYEDVVFFALAALLFRFWAVRAENRKSRKLDLRPGVLRVAMLLYRLGGVSASVMRIAFYAAAVGAIVWLAKTMDFWSDGKQLPHDIARMITAAGLLIGIRCWAASLGTVGRADEKRNLKAARCRGCAGPGSA
jgi:hypothetical protein